jgi:hypothetical protein
MLNPETDRVLADEMKGLLKDLRDKNTKLTDEKKAAESKLIWVIIALVVVLAFAVLSGGDGHHYHRY